MSFKLSDSTKPVPTHLKFIIANPDKVGIEEDIDLILLNPEWRTITFFAKSFKYNIKAYSDESFESNRDYLYKNLRRGYAKAKIKDKSDLQEPNYSVDITVESIPPEKGGRKYTLGNHRIRFENESSKESSKS